MIWHLLLSTLMIAHTLQPDETVWRYGGADREWHLVSLHGDPFDAKATLTFPARHEVAGRGPCNSFRSTNRTPYPWIKLGPIMATRRACPELQAETAYFKALSLASVVVIDGDTLTLSDEEKSLMIFKARG
ncbi:META domain containing protein [Sulfitobacter noctilucae]|uniref:META domain-containing protein n=1 Tax=Sulfitobacter noctilucae TaxID=1342302 RepID=UPI0004687EB7|nr:META domain-containing protein [Sulfitobacter noctilucae]KIN65266.1 META domain containing protein [Sulfitobacter noctilucae]